MGLRVFSFTAEDIEAKPMACAHELLDHFHLTAEKDGVETFGLIPPRARALLEKEGFVFANPKRDSDKP